MMPRRIDSSSTVALLLCITAAGWAAKNHSKPAKKRSSDATVWVNAPAPGALPAGASHHPYFSKAMGHDVGYCIYLPPGYRDNPNARYPVIYNLHGAGGDETR